MNHLDRNTRQTVRTLLLELARTEDDLAAQEAARTPYWQQQPATATGHREAATVLRGAAGQFIDAVPVPWK